MFAPLLFSRYPLIGSSFGLSLEYSLYRIFPGTGNVILSAAAHAPPRVLVVARLSTHYEPTNTTTSSSALPFLWLRHTFWQLSKRPEPMHTAKKSSTKFDLVCWIGSNTHTHTYTYTSSTSTVERIYNSGRETIVLSWPWPSRTFRVLASAFWRLRWGIHLAWRCLLRLESSVSVPLYCHWLFSFSVFHCLFVSVCVLYMVGVSSISLASVSFYQLSLSCIIISYLLPSPRHIILTHHHRHPLPHANTTAPSHGTLAMIVCLLVCACLFDRRIRFETICTHSCLLRCAWPNVNSKQSHSLSP